MDEKEFLNLLDAYVIDLYNQHKAHNDKHYPNAQQAFNGNYNTFSAEIGKRYVKIVSTSGGQKAVHCFIDITNGNILKSATWSQPQKNGVRGNLKDEKKPIFLRDFYIKK